MSERLRTDVPDQFYEWMRKNAPLPADTSDSELARYWLQFAARQWQLEEMRATGQYPANRELPQFGSQKPEFGSSDTEDGA